MDDIVKDVISWIKTNCMKDKPNMAVDSETSFFATNILDSLDFLNLVEYLQEQYGIEIDDDEMSPDNFENAAAVAALVTQLKA